MTALAIHHLALRTRDVPRLERFYSSIVGLPFVRRDGARSVWLRAGDAMLMIEQANVGEPTPQAGSLDLLAFTVTGADLNAAESACIRGGAPIEARTSYTLYIRDPDGRRVGLSVYAFEAAD